MREDLKYWIWLSSVPMIGARRGKQLLEHFGSPRNVWEATELELIKLSSINKNIVDLIKDQKIRDEADRHLENILRHDIHVVTIDDEQYPYYLKNIYDPPIALFVKGNISGHDRSVAIVGSRRASSYGLNMAETISCQLAQCGVTVISGMARGIDTYAHNGAIKGKGSTIAVLGCGLDIAYPVENKELMKKIIECGAVVSEYLPGMQPLPQNFPARNRIISGLSLGVVVVEANEKSGSLITANFALEQGREVFALPGNISSSLSRGSNKLIKEGAKIVTDIQDILEELNVCRITNNMSNDFQVRDIAMQKVFKGLEDDERKVAECIMQEPLHIDILAQKTGFSMQVLNSLLVMMELKGVVKQEPGKIFRLGL